MERKKDAPISGKQNLKRRDDFFPDINANGFVMSENTFPSFSSKVILDNSHNFGKYLDKLETLQNLDSSHADSDLLSLMARRLYKAEEQLSVTGKELESALSQLKEKDEEILNLRSKVEELEKKLDKDNDLSNFTSTWSCKYHSLLQSCLRYRKQVVEMEKFLADYGLVWIGDDDEKNKSTPLNILDNAEKPPSSQNINFDLLLKRLNEINVIQGEPKIYYTNEGATFKSPESVPLTLYANGMILFSGPFRKYSDPLSQEFLLDVIDGYYPSELQETYPDGVAFQVIDKHTMLYPEKEKGWIAFSGSGNRLGSKPQPHNVDQCKSPKSTNFEEAEYISSAYSSDEEVQKTGKLLMDYVTGLYSGIDLLKHEKCKTKSKTSDVKKAESCQSKQNLKSHSATSEQICRKKKKKIGSTSGSSKNLRANIVRNSSLPKILPNNMRHTNVGNSNLTSAKSSSSKLDVKQKHLTGDKILNLIKHESSNVVNNIFKEYTTSGFHHTSELSPNLEDILLPTSEYSSDLYGGFNFEDLIRNDRKMLQNLWNQSIYQQKQQVDNSQFGWSPEMKLLVEEDAEKEKMKQAIGERLTKLTNQQLLKKLPQVIVRNGKLITVRAEIEELLKDMSDTEIEVQNITSESVKNGKDCISLRIRHYDGCLIFMVKISPEETVGNLQQLLNDAIRTAGLVTHNYSIISRYIFPKTVALSESEKTLKQYGLVSNSVLTLHKVL